MSSSSGATGGSAFADLLAKGDAGGPRIYTPADAELSWCSIACPLNLQVRVETAAGDPLAGLEPLLPQVLERLLGQPLEAAPWGVPVLRVERAAGPAADEGFLRVTASVAAAPKAAKEGLFEVSTPVGPAKLRVEGLQDSAARQGGAPAWPGEEGATVLLLSLPSAWLEEELLQRARGQRAVDVADGTPWRAWLAQWGRVERLEVSAHLGWRPECGASAGAAACVLAATFARAADCARCAAALGGGRLLVLEGPRRAARVGAARCSPTDLEARAEEAWQEKLALEREADRSAADLVMQDVDAAVLRSLGDRFLPLVELLRRWAASGALRTALTIGEQQRLLEADAGAAGKSPERYRRACWYSAMRVVLQMEPGLETTEALALALCEHWRKHHGICVDFDTEALLELASTLRVVRDLSQREEDAARRSAEAQALSAERALLEELEEEEIRARSEQERREKKREKKKEREALRKARTSSGSSSSGCQPGDEFAEEAPLDAARRLLASLASPPSSPPCSSPEAFATPRSCSKASTVSGTSKEKAGRRPAAQPAQPAQQSRGSGAASATPASAFRKEPDLDTILAAVRKSEELHQQHQQPAAPAGPKLFQAAVAATKPKEEKRGSESPSAAKDPVGAKDGDGKSAAGAARPDTSSTSSTTSTAWEASSCSSSSEVTPPLREVPEAATYPAACASSSSGSAQCRLDPSSEGREDTQPAAAEPGADAAASLVGGGEPKPRRAWVDELEDEECEEGDEDESDLDGYEDSLMTSPSSSPTKRRRRRRRGGARINRAGATGRADEESLAPTPTCNGRRSVVTWGDLGLGIVRDHGEGDVAVAKAAPAPEAEAAPPRKTLSTLRSDAPDWTPKGVAAASGPPEWPGPEVGAPPPGGAGPAKLPDASSRCLSTAYGAQPQLPVTPVASSRMSHRDASSRFSLLGATPTHAASPGGYGQPAWGQEHGWGADACQAPMLPGAAVAQVPDWTYDASGRYAVQGQQPGPMAGPMTPVSQQPCYDPWAAGYAAAPAPYGDASLRSPHHGDVMVPAHHAGHHMHAEMHGMAAPHHGDMMAQHYHGEMHGFASPHHHAHGEVQVRGFASPHHCGEMQVGDFGMAQLPHLPPHDEMQGMTPPPQHSADAPPDQPGEMLCSWLHASGLPANGEEMAERLRAMAPEAYED